MPSNAGFNQAKKDKKDEFYTQLSDVEQELRHYKKAFEGKTILCNADDPGVSSFFKWFSLNYEELKLKKLITTCYKNQQMNLFSQNKSERAIYLEYNGDKNNNRVPDVNEIGVHYLKGNGDFRSQEVINILKSVDIVCTNPPFSLFRDFVKQLVKYNKKFIIVGQLGAITYNDIFKLLQEHKLWLGKSIHSGDREFGVPDNYPLNAANSRIDENGNKFIRVKGVRWFTNIGYKEQYKDLILYKKYTPEEYPTYDGHDGHNGHNCIINVGKTKEIPKNYKGMMGVPVSFFDKYNPSQFKIIGKMSTTKIDKFNYGYPYINGKRLYSRILIKRKGRQKK